MTQLQDFLNSPITGVARTRAPKAGDLFGLELECEGTRVDWDGTKEIINGWVAHPDGSLRNNHGAACEWVSNGPAPYKASVDRVNNLFDYFDKRKAKLVCSNRTSFHVHFNMGDKNAYQLVNMFILFTILEGVMDAYCGEDRVGNLFCLSSRHAEEQVDWMHDACFRHYSFLNIGEGMRYCSFNVAAINKFGTVEFRSMRGLDNREDVLSWLSILNEFTDYACYKMRNPVDLIAMTSQKSPHGLLQEVFSPENVRKLTANVSNDFVHQSVYEGMRLIQMLAYRIGTEFEQVRLRGRDFWASFSDDQEPKPDVAPEDIGRPDEDMFRPLGRGEVPRGAVRGRRRGRQGLPPFAELNDEVDRMRVRERAVQEARMLQNQWRIERVDIPARPRGLDEPDF